ncbi:MAG TPA: hypothetical protein PK074_05290 [Spirochaetales bacterium]|nr:hypothetical protein [Spirochaetales bacterium]HQK34117.1 hypothetical protein [Spirochaetales bacterium]HRV28037.1 hypothetical protein [Spirochaetia bacterium]
MNWLPFHIVFMSMAFVLALTGGLIARFGKQKRWWLTAHKTLNLTAVIIALAGITAAILMVSNYEGSQFASVHGSIGLMAGIWLILQGSVGFLMFSPKLARFAKLMRPVHRWSGRLLSLLMLINIVLGLSKILSCWHARLLSDTVYQCAKLIPATAWKHTYGKRLTSVFKKRCQFSVNFINVFPVFSGE